MKGLGIAKLRSRRCETCADKNCNVGEGDERPERT
jgi:hypothetical protein